jgi:hypothetical protein
LPSATNQKLIPSNRVTAVIDGTKNKVNVVVVLFIPKNESDAGDVYKAAAVAVIQITVAKATAKQIMARR